MSKQQHSAIQIGADIRALRKTRGMTIGAVATALGKSVGWLSQVERGKSKASSQDLEALAALFDIPIAMLLPDGRADAKERGVVVRAGQRRRMGQRVSGLTEDVITPDLTGDVQAVHVTFEPRSAQVTEIKRGSEEIGYILSGRLILTVDGQRHDLRRGDSFRIRGQAYTWENPMASATSALWIVSPPIM